MLSIEQKLRTALYPLYSELIEDVAPYSEEYELVAFAAQWGEIFPNKENDGILFVGRATNGWTYLTPDVDVLFGETNEAIFNQPNQMQWVHDAAGNPNGYNSRKSAFWRVIRGVSRAFYPDPELSHVAWSNVSKIAPDGANPSDELYYSQLGACQKILKAEISALSPRFVVFLTGNAWCRDFLDYLIPPVEQKVIDVAPWSRYSARVYERKGVFYLVSEHPQRKKEASHIDALTKMIAKYQ